MSHDCSMTKTVPPEIYGVRGNGICDRNEINCDTAFVVGNRIEESDDLSCRISKHVVSLETSDLSNYINPSLLNVNKTHVYGE